MLIQRFPFNVKSHSLSDKCKSTMRHTAYSSIFSILCRPGSNFRGFLCSVFFFKHDRRYVFFNCRHLNRGENNSCARTDLHFKPVPDSTLARKRDDRVRKAAMEREESNMRQLAHAHQQQAQHEALAKFGFGPPGGAAAAAGNN